MTLPFPMRMLIACFALVAAPAYALPSCAPTVRVADYDYPGAKVIPTTNNLILPTGKAVPANAQPLIITGRVLDSRCMPVAEAVVELWQAGPFGRWMIASDADLASPNPVFAGAGRTYTDINGSFSFITAFPAPSRYATPNVNIRVKAERMGSYTSALFFSGDKRNDQDKTYQRLSAAARKDVSIQMSEGENDTLLGTLDIVLQGKTPYRTY